MKSFSLFKFRLNESISFMNIPENQGLFTGRDCGDNKEAARPKALIHSATMNSSQKLRF